MKVSSVRILAVIALAVAAGGCTSAKRSAYREAFGKVYYLDGAGNLGYGRDMPEVLASAGFRGDVENITWTTFTGPIGDQLIRFNAEQNAKKLTKQIARYRRRHSETPLYVIGLSAGTGVGVWAVEALPADTMVDDMVLLGSSLSSDYDMTKCLKHVKGKVYVLSSSRDAVLTGFLQVLPTIDGQWFVRPAGLAGMKPPAGAPMETIELYKKKIVNIPWEPPFERLGNAGGHTDGTSQRFVRHYIARKLLGIGSDEGAKTDKEKE